MKVVITGHKRGIGKSVYHYFNNDSNELVGFSKSDGYDISNEQTIDEILFECFNADIFVNNAFDENSSQLILLQKVFNLWKNKSKIIINISSRHTNNEKEKYCLLKKQLDEFCQSNIFNLPNIINLKPGLIDTDRVKHVNNKKMDCAELVNILNFSLKSKIKIHSITFGL